jgi:hypothetical protein
MVDPQKAHLHAMVIYLARTCLRRRQLGLERVGLAIDLRDPPGASRLGGH